MNIFAKELVSVLSKHNKELSDLFKFRNEEQPQNIPPNTVLRIKASLTSDKSATLNVDQIELITAAFGLDDDDLDRLHAALVAEAIRTLVADRLDATLAEQLGKLTLTLLLEADPAKVKEASEMLLASVRGLPGEPNARRILRGIPAISEVTGTVSAADAAAFGMQDSVVDAKYDSLDKAKHELQAEAARKGESVPAMSLDVLSALETAGDAYHQGQLWLEVARGAAPSARPGYAAQARALLDRAARLARTCPEVAQATDEQRELQDAIINADADAATIV